MHVPKHKYDECYRQKKEYKYQYLHINYLDMDYLPCIGYATAIGGGAVGGNQLLLILFAICKTFPVILQELTR